MVFRSCSAGQLYDEKGRLKKQLASCVTDGPAGHACLVLCLISWERMIPLDMSVLYPYDCPLSARSDRMVTLYSVFVNDQDQLGMCSLVQVRPN